MKTSPSLIGIPNFSPPNCFALRRPSPYAWKQNATLWRPLQLTKIPQKSQKQQVLPCEEQHWKTQIKQDEHHCGRTTAPLPVSASHAFDNLPVDMIFSLLHLMNLMTVILRDLSVCLNLSSMYFLYV